MGALGKGGTPQGCECWFIFTPSTIVISTINHKIQLLVRQLFVALQILLTIDITSRKPRKKRTYKST